jgi:uncharacterized protein (UPF0333 family)
MKNQILFFFLIVISVISIHAEEPKKSKTTTKPVVVSDIAADAFIFSNSNKEEEINLTGKDVLLSGNDNKLTFTGVMGNIQITGKNNDITIVSVKKIVITGSGNFVSWEKSDNASGKPFIQDKGGYNNVEKRSGNAQTKED